MALFSRRTLSLSVKTQFRLLMELHNRVTRGGALKGLKD